MRTGKWRGDRLEGARKLAGLSATQVAAHVDVTAETVRRWEGDGNNGPNADQLARLATLLKVDLDYLVNLQDETEAKSAL